MVGHHLCEADRGTFERDGFLSPLPCFSLEETAVLRSKLEAIEARSVSGRFGLHITTGWAWDLVHDPRIVDPITDVLGPNVLLWSIDWFIKEPGSTYVSYHQDATYWGLEPHNVVTAWIALSDAGQATGPMKFLPGTHTWPILEQEDTFAEDNMLSRGQTITRELDESTAILAPLTRGEMSLHHVRVIHASEPNTTNDRRIGMVLRYCATDVRQTKVDGDSAILVAGVDEYGHFGMIERPVEDMGEAEREMRKANAEVRQRALHSADYD